MKRETKQQEGFSAYEEIQALAVNVLGNDVTVEAAIFGNDYKIIANGRIIQGTSEQVRALLLGVKP